jgi:xanthine dehydrogenase YagR molybdenum-binding subunit
MDSPAPEDRLEEMVQGVIGRPANRSEGPLKVSGRASYADDWPLENLVYGFLVRAPVPSGRTRSFDHESVLRLPGVLCVVDSDRLLRNPAQGGANEAPVRGAKEIFYLGQPVAAVVAESLEQARHGAYALKMSVDVDDHVVVDPEAPDAKVDRPAQDQFEQGDIDEAMTCAAYTVDETYRTPAHNSAAMEPLCSVAEWQDGKLLLRGSYQMLKYNKNEIADSLGIDPSDVRILSPYVGGGFGSKLGIAPEAVVAALASQSLDRPVAVAMTRQQVFEATMRRSETRQRIRLAADADGSLVGIGHDVRVSNLEEETFSEPVAQATHFLYRGQNRRIVHEVARVNRTCAGSVRAPGEAVGVQALENAMDELAERTGLDPVEIRLRNIPPRHPEEGKPYSSRKLKDALVRGAELFEWRRRHAQPGSLRDGEWLLGVGVASAARVNILSEAKARVTLHPNGKAVVASDMTDIGTGTYTILGQIAAEMLGLSTDDVTVMLGDTDLPEGSGSGGSWGASSTGSAVLLACEELRQRICEKIGCPIDRLAMRDGHVIGENRRHALTEILDGEALIATGHIIPGEAAERVHQGSYGAHFAEVGVNMVTGETRVRRMLGVFAAGRILNEKTARSQCYGGMTFGIGIALTEELIHDHRDGHIVNRDFAEYHLPVNLDVPQLDVHFLEERDPWAGPLHAKGIGELAVCGAAAAITNAIYNACGVRVRDYPATPDKIIEGLERLEQTGAESGSR